MKTRLQPVFAGLVNPVKLVFFTQKNACSPCAEQGALLRELSTLSDKVHFEKYDFVLNGDEVMNYKIDKIPATAVVGRRDFGLRFYGLTVGYEFSSLINDIVMVSTERTGIDLRLGVLVKSIAENVHLQVMVSLTCPHCTNMVRVAHQLAFANENIRADMVDLTQFPYLAQRYNVTSVPKTIINETASILGALPAGAVFLEILKVVNPERYQAIEKEMT
ncbi:MAG: protein disulfide oxidoreductase [Bacillota bacterium]